MGTDQNSMPSVQRSGTWLAPFQPPPKHVALMTVEQYISNTRYAGLIASGNPLQPLTNVTPKRWN
eukprot:3039051-Amphidinium_carterae.1